jgi:hypothetical protein
MELGYPRSYSWGLEAPNPYSNWAVGVPVYTRTWQRETYAQGWQGNAYIQQWQRERYTEEWYENMYVQTWEREITTLTQIYW